MPDCDLRAVACCASQWRMWRAPARTLRTAVTRSVCRGTLIWRQCARARAAITSHLRGLYYLVSRLRARPEACGRAAARFPRMCPAPGDPVVGVHCGDRRNTRGRCDRARKAGRRPRISARGDCLAALAARLGPLLFATGARASAAVRGYSYSKPTRAGRESLARRTSTRVLARRDAERASLRFCSFIPCVLVRARERSEAAQRPPSC